ncbi:LuxR C-terminal-related transcriptional regulator [Leucobacter sp. PH1c]|uniref:LuxR C-terminal-related transcriptional regulator n=1 Tax=Leucobacter sp. PH1c TaxID=1397278 RepID=UPI00046A6260|nr:LuxR C-terminal-related transcriptional regulator [Leucobacter sp. PH1c]
MGAPTTHPEAPLLLETLSAAVQEFARETRFPVAFGGFNTDDITRVTAFAGVRTGSLTGLTVRADRGLGGKAMTEHRARLAPDYARSSLITHDYDEQIGGEGIVTLLAMPVIVGGEVRAVLYGGSRERNCSAPIRLEAGAAVARALAREIRVQQSVSAPRGRTPVGPPVPLGGDALELVRGEHAELRSIAAGVDDADVRDRLTALADRLARLGESDPTADAVQLSPREVDVLAHTALGATNAEIGRSLQLAENTVKSYLRTAMAKLETNTRHAAVAAARRQGLLP